jgi:cytochrome c553
LKAQAEQESIDSLQEQKEKAIQEISVIDAILKLLNEEDMITFLAWEKENFNNRKTQI